MTINTWCMVRTQRIFWGWTVEQSLFTLWLPGFHNNSSPGHQWTFWSFVMDVYICPQWPRHVPWWCIYTSIADNRLKTYCISFLRVWVGNLQHRLIAQTWYTMLTLMGSHWFCVSHPITRFMVTTKYCMAEFEIFFPLIQNML
jgi:hypothetical protein